MRPSWVRPEISLVSNQRCATIPLGLGLVSEERSLPGATGVGRAGVSLDLRWLICEAQASCSCTRELWLIIVLRALKLPVSCSSRGTWREYGEGDTGDD